MTDVVLKIVAVATLLVLLYRGEQYIERRGYDRAMTQAQAQIEGLNRAAADRLAAETEKTRTVEQALQTAKNAQENQDATHQKTVASLSDRLRALADPSGRLRDPHASAGCGPGGSSTPGAAASAPGDRAADPAVAGGLLSADFSELLQRLSYEADTINAAYASCRADAYTVRGEP